MPSLGDGENLQNPFRCHGQARRIPHIRNPLTKPQLLAKSPGLHVNPAPLVFQPRSFAISEASGAGRQADSVSLPGLWVMVLLLPETWHRIAERRVA